MLKNIEGTKKIKVVKAGPEFFGDVPQKREEIGSSARLSWLTCARKSPPSSRQLPLEVLKTLHVEGYRVPLKALENDTDKPEIHEAHHRHLAHWALHRASPSPIPKPSTPRAATAEAAFTRYFGFPALMPGAV